MLLGKPGFMTTDCSLASYRGARSGAAALSQYQAERQAGLGGDSVSSTHVII